MEIYTISPVEALSYQVRCYFAESSEPSLLNFILLALFYERFCYDQSVETSRCMHGFHHNPDILPLHYPDARFDINLISYPTECEVVWYCTNELDNFYLQRKKICMIASTSLCMLWTQDELVKTLMWTT